MATKTNAARIKQQIRDVSLNKAFRDRYVSYGMHVLQSRALPDVRDGLKPVHRRVLYAMNEAGFRPDRAYVKSARPVSETMGNYHPHGDSSIYDALVRLTQTWSMRVPLVDGQGNFGSRGDDGAAAMRYTESRMAAAAMAALDGLDENTVDMQPNYDEKTTEPVVLPARLPFLLINGSEGMAVGASTNIPPHNPGEVGEAVRWALANPTASTEERHQAYREAIPGPDFPTGGVIRGTAGIDATYTTGRGRIIMDGVAHVEPGARGTNTIVITQTPFGTNIDKLAAAIGQAAIDGKLPGVTAVDDESSDRDGLRLTVTCKGSVDPEHLIALIKDKTGLRSTFGSRLLAVSPEGVPRDYTLGEMIDEWIAHQLIVIVRRSEYRRDKALERRHIVAALIKAVDNLDEVIRRIRASSSTSEANQSLREFLGIDEQQAKAILEIPLRRLTQLGISELREELATLDKTIADNQAIIDSPRRQRTVLRKEMDTWLSKVDTERRTEIVAEEATKATAMAAIPASPIVICANSLGYLWRTTPEAFERRNGTADPSEAVTSWATTTQTPLIGIDEHGTIYRVLSDEVSSNVRKPTHPAGLFGTDTPLSAIFPLPEDGHIVQLVSNGSVKIAPVDEYRSNRAKLNGLRLTGDESVLAAIWMPPTSTHLSVLSERGHIVTVARAALRFSASKSGGAAPFYKRAADDNPVVVLAHENSGSLTTATDGGYTKRTAFAELPETRRGSRGVPVFKRTRAHGRLIQAWAAPATDSLLILPTDGSEPSTMPLSSLQVTTMTGVGRSSLPPGAMVFLRSEQR